MSDPHHHSRRNICKGHEHMKKTANGTCSNARERRLDIEAMAVPIKNAINKLGQAERDGAYGGIKEMSELEPHPAHVGLMSVISIRVQFSPLTLQTSPKSE